MTISGSYPQAMERGGQPLGRKASSSRLNISLCLGIIVVFSGLLWTMLYMAVAALLR